MYCTARRPRKIDICKDKCNLNVPDEIGTCFGLKSIKLSRFLRFSFVQMKNYSLKQFVFVYASFLSWFLLMHFNTLLNIST